VAAPSPEEALHCYLKLTFSEVPENLLNNHRVFYAGDDLDRAFTFLADLDVDIEHPF
jgi:hypothetical protein